MQDLQQAVEDVDFDGGQDPLQVLNYPLQDEHSFKCSLYDSPAEPESQENLPVSDAVRVL